LWWFLYGFGMAITPELPFFIIFRDSFAGTCFLLLFSYFRSYLKSDLGSVK
jgi:hypothetical protein